MRGRITPGAQILLGLFLGGAFVWFMEAALFELRWGWTGRILDVRGDRVTLKLGDGERRLFAVLDGEIVVDEEAGTVELLAPGAHVSIEERTRRTETWYLATWSDEGRRVEWRREGELVDPGPSSRAWLRERLLEVERSTGRAAADRTVRLLERGGVPAVLEELEELRSGDVLARYAGALLERARPSSEESLRLIRLSGDRIGADRELASILERVPLDEPPAWVAFSRAARTIGSDATLADLLVRRLPAGEAGREPWIEASRTIGSDAELGRALRALADSVSPGEPLPPGFVETLATIGSDAEHRKVLEAALVERTPTAGDLDRLLREAGSIGSDGQLSALLSRVAESFPGEALGEGFWKAAHTIGTDSDLADALVHAASVRKLGREDLERLVEASRTLGTDRFQADVLVAALEAGAPPELIEERGLDTLGSEGQRRRVEEELGRRGLATARPESGS